MVLVHDSTAPRTQPNSMPFAKVSRNAGIGAATDCSTIRVAESTGAQMPKERKYSVSAATAALASDVVRMEIALDKPALTAGTKARAARDSARTAARTLRNFIGITERHGFGPSQETAA